MLGWRDQPAAMHRHQRTTTLTRWNRRQIAAPSRHQRKPHSGSREQECRLKDHHLRRIGRASRLAVEKDDARRGPPFTRKIWFQGGSPALPVQQPAVPKIDARKLGRIHSNTRQKRGGSQRQDRHQAVIAVKCDPPMAGIAAGQGRQQDPMHLDAIVQRDIVKPLFPIPLRRAIRPAKGHKRFVNAAAGGHGTSAKPVPRPDAPAQHALIMSQTRAGTKRQTTSAGCRDFRRHAECRRRWRDLHHLSPLVASGVPVVSNDQAPSPRP